MKKEDLLKFCKLYRGQKNNPYNSNCKNLDEYLRYQIWDAEFSVCTNSDWWEDVWHEQNKDVRLNNEDKAEEIFKLCIFDKLRKMSSALPDVDFISMYFAL